jgi:hypothetical protein
MQKIYQYEKEIKELLTTFPDTRDNDVVLYSRLMKRLIGNIGYYNLTAKDLLLGIHTNKYPSMDSVGRVRRRLQENESALRGVVWRKRHKDADSIRSETKAQQKSSIQQN